MKLTTQSVASLVLDDRADVIHFDEALPGFGVRLRRGAGGKVLRSYVAQYRHGGTSRRVRLGDAAVLSADEARAAARKVLAQATLGEDPQSDKAGRRDANKIRLKDVIEEYLETKGTLIRRRTGTPLRPRTMADNRAYLLGPFFRTQHSTPIDLVASKAVALCLRAIARNHGEASMALARAKLSAFFVWAMQEGIATANPVTATRQPDPAPARERVLTNDELAAVWNACEDDAYGRIIKLLILTGARRGEIGGMAWSEIDLDRGIWTLPAARSKNHRAHTLPIMPMMAEILAGVPHMVSNDQLFGRRAGGFSHWGVSKRELDQRSGVTGWTVHDIRRTTATRMADLEVAPHVIEAVLNHQSGHKAGVAGIYNRASYEREIRAALATWHDHLHTIVEGGERKILSYPA